MGLLDTIDRIPFGVTLAVERRVVGDRDTLDQLEHAQIRALGADDDERVRAVVRDDLRDVELTGARRTDRAATAARLRGAAGGGPCGWQAPSPTR